MMPDNVEKEVVNNMKISKQTINEKMKTADKKSYINREQKREMLKGKSNNNKKH